MRMTSQTRLWPPVSVASVLALGLTLCLAIAPLAGAAQRPSVAAPPAARQLPGPANPPSFADVVRRVLPAVVSITAVVSAAPLPEDDNDVDDEAAPDSGASPPVPFDELLKRFFEPYGGSEPPEPQGRHAAQGSGFIIDPAGYIVTGDHVVASAEQVIVILQDDRRYSAKIVGHDELSDLALLKIETGRALPFVGWGDSDAVQVGDWILAVGNPFGLGGTVSAGILSARGRDIHVGPYDDFLQIDAPLNRGNSGGPTFNLMGQVIGVNSAIYTPSGGSVGVGFAIPANLARPVIDQLRAHGMVTRGWLGVQIQDVTPGIARSFALPNAAGALITDVSPGGPAEKAGLRPGDVVLAFNGQKVAKPRDFSIAVAKAPIGKKVAMTVWRRGKTIAVSPVIASQPEPSRAPQPAHPEQSSVSSLGLRLGPLTEQRRSLLHLAANAQGVVVLDMSTDSPFSDSGLRPGDVIEEINRDPVTTPQSAADRLQDAAVHTDRSLLLLINREGTKRFIALTPAADGALE